MRSLDGAICGYIAFEASVDPALAPRALWGFHTMGGLPSFEAGPLVVYVSEFITHEAGLLRRSIYRVRRRKFSPNLGRRLWDPCRSCEASRSVMSIASFRVGRHQHRPARGLTSSTPAAEKHIHSRCQAWAHVGMTAGSDGRPGVVRIFQLSRFTRTFCTAPTSRDSVIDGRHGARGTRLRSHFVHSSQVTRALSTA